MALTRVRARLATTHPIPAYGGLQLSREVLEDVASAVATGAMPMNFEHDISRPVLISDVETGVEQLDDGHFAAWVEFDVDGDVWAGYEAGVSAAGAPGGMSISFTGPLAGRTMPDGLPVVVAADGHHFDDDDIDQAVAILRRLGFEAGGTVLYQLSAVPLAKVVFDLLWPQVMAVGTSLVAAAVYDAAKSFFHQGRHGLVFNIHFKQTPRGKRVLNVNIEASNADELRAALQRLPEVLQAGTAGTFVSQAGTPLERLPADDIASSDGADDPPLH